MAVITSNNRRPTTLLLLITIVILTTFYSIFTFSGVGSEWQIFIVKSNGSTPVDEGQGTSGPGVTLNHIQPSNITMVTPSPTEISIITESPITILAWTDISFIKTTEWGRGREPFKHFQCPVSNCLWTKRRGDFQKADAVLFHMRITKRDEQKILLSKKRPPGQKWIAYIRESQALVTDDIKYIKGMVNVTMGFRHGMDIPYPYGYIYPRTSQQWHPPADKDYTKGKTKMVAWIASNCAQVRSPRLQYARELGRHIQVDIYGRCGSLNCKYSKGYHNIVDPCFAMINHTYKFYLAFENSICVDYMTEKVYRTLEWDILPIVMGGANYTAILPPKSFIDVRDFSSPKDLASYLKLLDADPKLYNSYFAWKRDLYAKENPLVSGDFFCNICEYLHRTRGQTKQYDNLAQWYRKDECMDSNAYYRTIKQSS